MLRPLFNLFGLFGVGHDAKATLGKSGQASKRERSPTDWKKDTVFYMRVYIWMVWEWRRITGEGAKVDA